MNPNLVESFVVEFTLYNEAQQMEFTKHLEGLLKKLRIRLNNYKISIKTTIFANSDFKALGTLDKFHEFARKNPNLLKLKEQLNLELG